MNRKLAQALAVKIGQSAGDRTARAAYDPRSGEWQVKTASGTVRSAFDWYLAERKLTKTVSRLRATSNRIAASTRKSREERQLEREFDRAHERLRKSLPAALSAMSAYVYGW